MQEFIFCPEYGIQPVFWNTNFGRSEANGNPLVIINQSAPKSLKWTGSITYKAENEVIALDRVLYSRLITLKDFNGFEIIYVGKRSNFYLQNVAFDFTNDKWKIRDLNHNMNNYKFNVWDRGHIKNILNNFLTKKQDEVFNLFYTEIYKADGLNKALRVLESVIELKDSFLTLLTPLEQTFLDPAAAGTGTGTGNGGNPGGGTGTGTGSGGNSGGKTGTGTDTSNGKAIAAVAVAAAGLWVLRKKKVI